jgi:hypothetical protein
MLPTRDFFLGAKESSFGVATADEVIKRDFILLHLLTTAFGTKRMFYVCRRMSVLGGKAVMQRTSRR